MGKRTAGRDGRAPAPRPRRRSERRRERFLALARCLPAPRCRRARRAHQCRRTRRRSLARGCTGALGLRRAGTRRHRRTPARCGRAGGRDRRCRPDRAHVGRCPCAAGHLRAAARPRRRDLCSNRHGLHTALLCHQEWQRPHGRTGTRRRSRPCPSQRRRHLRAAARAVPAQHGVRAHHRAPFRSRRGRRERPHAAPRRGDDGRYRPCRRAAGRRRRRQRAHLAVAHPLALREQLQGRRLRMADRPTPISGGEGRRCGYDDDARRRRRRGQLAR